MKKLIWKIRYAMRIRKCTLSPWRFCFECARISMEEVFPEDWHEVDPRFAADDEVSYWGD